MKIILYIASCVISYMLLRSAFKNNKLNSQTPFDICNIELSDIISIFLPIYNIIYAIKTYIELSVNTDGIIKQICNKLF